jgi:transcriptional regulator with XRE-family HTH domain
MQSAAHRQAGAEVRAMRVDRGWTHEDMSRQIFRDYGATYATSPRTIWRVESGHKPSVRKQFAIAQVLGVLPSQLWVAKPPTKTPAKAAA